MKDRSAKSVIATPDETLTPWFTKALPPAVYPAGEVTSFVEA